MNIFFLFSFVLIIILNIHIINSFKLNDKSYLSHKSINNLNIESNDEILGKKLLFESFKFYNNSIYWNIPRNDENKNNNTFLIFQNIKDKASPWPNEEYNNYQDNVSNCERFISVISFEFDDDNNLYILDEGSSFCSSKLFIFNLNGDLNQPKKYDLSIKFNENFLFNDFTIDTNNNYVFILCSNFDSNDNKYNSSEIILIDFNHDDITHISLKINFDENYLLPENINIKNNLYKKGISITLSCDGESLFISPLLSRKIYSVSTEKIRNKEKYINIEEEAYKNEATSSIIISNIGNLYFPGIEEKVIYMSGQIDNDLSRFDYRSMDKIDISKDISNNTFISKIYLYNGIFYLTIKKYDSDNNIYEANYLEKRITEENDYENTYVYKCSGLAYKYKWSSSFVWIIFALIVIMIIIFVVVENKQDMDNNKKNN